MNTAAHVLVAMVAVINALPLAGLASKAALERAYAVTVDRDVALLLRHRALGFGVVAGLLAASVHVPALRGWAIAAAAVSMGGFVVLAWIDGTSNPALRRVALVDLVALALLAAASALYAFAPSPGP